jgi:hypothetical protein
MRTIAFAVLAAFAWHTGAAMAAEPRSAPEPSFRVGDRWVYKVTDRNGRMKAESEEVREVTASGPEGITITTTRSKQSGVTSQTEVLAAPGLLRSGAVCAGETRSFAEPIQQLLYPLEPGKRWHKRFASVTEPGGKKGNVSYSTRVRGWEKIQAAGGTVDALRLLIVIRLDDSDAFRNETTCNFTVWYAPSVRGSVREQRDGGYTSKGTSPAPTRLIDATYELVSFTPGKA